MNKNLKKVISATAALAVSATGMAAFAASYPDVSDTATYAQAVQELSALGVINGYEDGTFGPDNNVTRAEITKMIVTALGKTAVSAAEAAAGKDTQFADVTASHWAAGFVATGTSATAQNFINGYSETEFGPNDNVTFAQAVKMLVGAIGYTTYAENNGGWPNGYLKYGYSLKITDGVTGVSNDTQVTRAQVAQMIDNALKCAICVTDGYTTNAWGQQTPNYVVKDGSGDLDDDKDGFQCLLNYAHDSYLVYGRVQATHKSDSSVDTDKVEFSVEKSDNWEGYKVTKGVSVNEGDLDNYQMYIGESGADQNLLTYAQAIISKDSNDEYTIVSLVPYGASEQVEFKSDDFAEDKTTLNDTKGTIYAYQNGSDTKTTSYKLDTAKILGGDEGGVYVNGKQITSVTSTEELQSFLDKYVDGNISGTVTLIDSPSVGASTTDGNYDYVMVTYYKTGVVDSVTGSTDEPTIYFSDAESGVSTLAVDYTDDDYEYDITLDGQAIKASELQPGDVLSIAYDVVEGYSDSTSYTILVSRNTVEGQCRSIDKNEDPYEYTLDNGEVYKAAYSDVSELESGVSYTLFLDVFGNIAKMEEISSTKKIAVLDNVYISNGDQYYASIITGDGKKTSYELKDQAEAVKASNVVFGTDTGYTTADPDAKVFIANRVVEYNITSANKLTLKNQGTSASPVYAMNIDKYQYEGEYKDSTGKIGSIKVTDGVTGMIDLSDYYTNDSYSSTGVGSTYTYDGSNSAMAVSDLSDGDSYTAYGYSKTSSDSIYQFVLVMDGVAGWNVNSSMAVYSSSSTGQTPSGNDATIITALADGETKTLYMDGIYDEIDDMTEGSVFFYKTNSDGEIESGDIKPVMENVLADGYDSFYTAALNSDFAMVDSTTAAEFPTWNKKSSIDEKDCKLVFGPIVGKSGNTIYIGDIDHDKVGAVGTDAPNDYDLASDVTVYKYDYSKRAKYRTAVTSTGDVIKTTFSIDACVDYGSSAAKDKEWADYASADLTADNTSTYGKVNFAVAKVVDDEITEIMVVLPSTSKN